MVLIAGLPATDINVLIPLVAENDVFRLYPTSMRVGQNLCYHDPFRDMRPIGLTLARNRERRKKNEKYEKGDERWCPSLWAHPTTSWNGALSIRRASS